MSAEIYSIEKKDYYKGANIFAMIGGFITTILASLPTSLYSSYNTLYCIYRSLYQNVSEGDTGSQEVISRKILFQQCNDAYNFFMIGLIIFIACLALYIIGLGTLYLVAYFKTNRNK